MPTICYTDCNFNSTSRRLIDHAVEIIAEYQEQGYRLTLRQLYYQFVSRDLLANTVQSYKRLGSIINDARLAGLIDWDAIEDRTRNLKALSHWDSPKEIIEACAAQFRIDLWNNQAFRPEIWVEKEALASVVERAATDWDVPFFCCRGYTSQSEMWGAAMRQLSHIEDGKKPYIIHLGDHDPSGIDMSRDITDRLNLFLDHHLGVTGEDHFEFTRIALNFDQIEEYNPPPNPAKATDARFNGYQRKFGDESWELDALDPKTLNRLITDKIIELIDQDQWEADKAAMKKERANLVKVSKSWDAITKFVGKKNA